MAKTTTRKSSGNPRLTPEERAQRITEAKSKLDAAVEGLLTSDGWQRFVQSSGWLRKYSLNNILMIMIQCPNASDVRPLSKWNEVGRRVRKGERALRIWAPSIRKVDVTVQSENVDGSITEETHKRDMIGHFRLVNVFDVSQTEGEPLPEATAPRVKAQQLTGDAPAELWDKLAAEVANEGYTLERGDCGGANGTTFFLERRVRVRADVDDAQAVKTLAHELAHILLEHDKRDYVRERGACEVEAESVACIVADIAGLDTGAYSVPYVANWAGDVKTVKDAAKRVLKVADEIVKRLDLVPADQDNNELVA